VRVPDDPIKRRRLGALAAAAALALVAGSVVGAGAGEDAPAPAPVVAGDSPEGGEDGGDEEAPAQRAPAASGDPVFGGAARGENAARVREAGQTIVLRFDGTSVPDYVLEAFREQRAAGVILFRDNVTSREQLRAMTGAIAEASGGRALVMTDQEGGQIRNVPWAAPQNTAPAQSTEAAAREAARATARDLLAEGVNVNLAPVADVGRWEGSVMRSRAYPGGEREIAPLVAAAVRGHADAGVLSTAKHFPGLGRSTVNTDFGFATVEGRGEVAPFTAAIEAGVPLVMAGHQLHPELDPERIASQSPAILQGLLREQLGFRGACVTDSLEAKAIVERTTTPTAAARSMQAGCDLMLTTGKGSYLHVLRRLADEARDPAFRERLAEARGRIGALDLPRR
jgi:beta-N-acetylhexosaminidase